MNSKFSTFQRLTAVAHSERMTRACVALTAAVLACATLTARAQNDAPQGRMITSLAIAINPSTHKVYAVNEGAGTVSVLDERSGVTRGLKVGRGPISIAINRLTDRVYVANTESGTISVIDGNRDEVIATIQGESHPYVLAVNEATNKVYVTNTYSDAVTVIDGVTNTARALKVGSADGIAVDSIHNKIFLMGYEDPNIRVVDVATGVVSKVAVGAHLWGIAFDESSDTLYLAHTGTADIVALNGETHEVLALPVGTIPCAVAVNPVTKMVYAVNYGDQTLSVIDRVKEKVVATLPVGEHPQAVAVDSARNLIYVANVHGSSVTMIDGAKSTVIGTYAAGRNPYALAVDPGTGQVFTANYGDPSLTAIDAPHGVERK